jgi:hypothetical protein
MRYLTCVWRRASRHLPPPYRSLIVPEVEVPTTAAPIDIQKKSLAHRSGATCCASVRCSDMSGEQCETIKRYEKKKNKNTQNSVQLQLAGRGRQKSRPHFAQVKDRSLSAWRDNLKASAYPLRSGIGTLVTAREKRHVTIYS